MDARDAWAIAGLGVLTFFIVAGGAVLFGAIGYLDPWIYTGYIQDYGEQLSRWGRTYYSARVAAIWPQGILNDLFGDLSYLVARWLILMGCGTGVALYLRRYGSRWVAYAGGGAMMVSAPLLLEMQDDYTQEVAIAYALLALPLLTARRWPWAIAGGALMSLAVNAHEGVVYLAIPLLILAAVQVATGPGPVRQFAIRTGCLIGGALAVQALLSFIMAAQYGWVRSNWYFQEIQLKFASELSGGLARNWSVPWDNPYGRVMTTVIVVVVWLAVAGTVVAVRRVPGWRLTLGTGLGALALLGLILYSHFVKGVGFVGLAYYLVFATTFVTLAAWAIAAQFARGALARPIAITGIVFAFTITFLLPAALAVGSTWNVLWWAGVGIAFGALIAATTGHLRVGKGRGIAIGALALAALVIPLGPHSTAEPVPDLYRAVTGAAKPTAAAGARAEGVRGLAMQFFEYVQDTAPVGVPFLVYYPGRPEFNSIQSMTLWGYSCVDCASGAAAFPGFSGSATERLRAAGSPLLIVMANSREDLMRALRNAEGLGLGYSDLGPIHDMESGSQRIWIGSITAKPSTTN
jgi:hypothetical protein